MPSKEEIEKAKKVLEEAGIRVFPVENKPTVKIKFVGDGKGIRHYTGDNGANEIFTVYADPKKNQSSVAMVTPEKAQRLERDFPNSFKVLAGRKNIQEYNDKMMGTYETK